MKKIIAACFFLAVQSQAEPLKPGMTYGQVSTALNAAGTIDRTQFQDGHIEEVFGFTFWPCWAESRRAYVEFVDGRLTQWTLAPRQGSYGFVCEGSRVHYTGPRLQVIR